MAATSRVPERLPRQPGARDDVDRHGERPALPRLGEHRLAVERRERGDRRRAPRPPASTSSLAHRPQRTPSVPCRSMERPPSVDALARSLAASGLPHPLLVDVARQAIADGAVADAAGPRRGPPPHAAHARSSTRPASCCTRTSGAPRSPTTRTPAPSPSSSTWPPASAARANAPSARCSPGSAAPRTPSSSTTARPRSCSCSPRSPPGGRCRSAAARASRSAAASASPR